MSPLHQAVPQPTLKDGADSIPHLRQQHGSSGSSQSLGEVSWAVVIRGGSHRPSRLPNMPRSDIKCYRGLRQERRIHYLGVLVNGDGAGKAGGVQKHPRIADREG